MASSVAYGAETGAPLAGLPATWFGLLDATTGLPITPTSDPVDLGDGQYRLDGLTEVAVGIIDFTAAASPRYVPYYGVRRDVVAAFDTEGVPLAGLEPTWLSFKVEATDSDTTQPARTGLGSGLYRTTLPAGTVGVLDFTDSASPRFVQMSAPGLPIVTVVSPAVGAPLAARGAIVFDVTDTAPLRRIFVSMAFGVRRNAEVVHDGDAFGPLYGRSTRAAIAGGYRYTVRRVLDWPEGPRKLKVHPIDVAGSEPA